MARVKTVTKDSTTEEILAEICRVDDKIKAAAAELKELKAKKRTLNKWLKDAESREYEEKNKEALDKIVALIKEKGLTIDDIEKICNK